MKKLGLVLFAVLFTFNANAFDLAGASNKFANDVNKTSEAVEAKKAEAKAEKEARKAKYEAKKAEAKAEKEARKAKYEAKKAELKAEKEAKKAEYEAEKAKRKKAFEDAKGNLKNAFGK